MNFDLNESLSSEQLIYDSDENSAEPSRFENITSSYSRTEFEVKLAVGSVFGSELEDVYSLYNQYARCEGFSIRRGKQEYFRNTEEVKAKIFYCSCEDSHDNKRSKDTTSCYKKQITRSCCKAKIRVARRSLGENWKVTRFVKEHNHELLVNESYLLRSSRNLCPSKKAFLENFDSAGIGVNTACKLMEFEAGGPENVGFIRSDSYTHIQKLRRVTKVENGDANALLEFFTEQSNKEPYFFWKVQLDDDGRLMKFFFRDTRSEIDYKYSRGVLFIDTTYRANKYNLVCAPFVGINHHSKNIMFALAFMSDETTKSFEWLFATFLESVHGKEQQVVFSDQCKALMNGIDYTFKTARHRLCQWHINQNAPAHFGSLNGDSDFKRMWFHCMNGCENEQEFEVLWQEMVDTYALQNKSWFDKMYNLRDRWASVFTQNLFSAGQHATSRSEATNRVLKMLCKQSSSLHTFVKQFENIQRDWRRKEREDDALCLGMLGILVEGNHLLEHAAKVYTRSVYKKFQLQVMSSLNIEITHSPPHSGAVDLEFIVSSSPESEHTRRVSYNIHTHRARCSCHMWVTHGILCCYILKIYTMMHVHSLPEDYILRRWTRDAKLRISETFSSPAGSQPGGSDMTQNMVFVNHIMTLTYQLALDCCSNSNWMSLLAERMHSVRDELHASITNRAPRRVTTNRSGNNDRKSDTECKQFLNPPLARTRGRNNVNLDSKAATLKGKMKKRKSDPKKVNEKHGTNHGMSNKSSQNWDADRPLQSKFFKSSEDDGCAQRKRDGLNVDLEL